MGFFRFEKDGALSILIDPVNLAVVAGGDVETAIGVKSHVPDVLLWR